MELPRRSQPQADSQVVASLQNQNVRTDLRNASCKKPYVSLVNIQSTRDQLLSTCGGWPNGEKRALTCVQSKLDQSQCNSKQVGGQTKRKLDAKGKRASRVRLAETFEETYYKSITVEYLFLY